MNEESFVLSQSKYYTPALNGAIFDGPFRIYFAQPQEEEALKIYFHLQNELSDLFEQAKDHFKENERNIYVMLYPSSEVFERSFDVEPFYQGLSMELLKNEFVFGIQGEIVPAKLKYLTLRVQSIIEDWGFESQTPDFSPVAVMEV